jgi:hypothetical protein
MKDKIYKRRLRQINGLMTHVMELQISWFKLRYTYGAESAMLHDE